MAAVLIPRWRWRRSRTSRSCPPSSTTAKWSRSTSRKSWRATARSGSTDVLPLGAGRLGPPPATVSVVYEHDGEPGQAEERTGQADRQPVFPALLDQGRPYGEQHQSQDGPGRDPGDGEGHHRWVQRFEIAP